LKRRRTAFPWRPSRSTSRRAIKRVGVYADDKLTFAKVMEPAESKTIESSGKIRYGWGTAASRVTANGKPVGRGRTQGIGAYRRLRDRWLAENRMKLDVGSWILDVGKLSGRQPMLASARY
jgi:hypothetical protein